MTGIRIWSDESKLDQVDFLPECVWTKQLNLIIMVILRCDGV